MSASLELDENLAPTHSAALERAGHDVATISVQRMCGASDADVIAACAKERRCLVTLDLDFANPLRFPPREFAGIVVLRLPSRRAATRSQNSST